MKRLSGLKFAPAEYDTHWEALQDMPNDAFETAVSVAQQVCEDFPSPAKLRRFSRPPGYGVRCWYGHEPPCATSSECRDKFFGEAREARQKEAS